MFISELANIGYLLFCLSVTAVLLSVFLPLLVLVLASYKVKVLIESYMESIGTGDVT